MKQEDEWDRPRIVRFHDIISDSEIAKVKELAKPRVSPILSTSSEELPTLLWPRVKLFFLRKIYDCGSVGLYVYVVIF